MNTTELKALAKKATPGPWFVVGQPWNPKADFIVAGSEDPHVGQYVADTEDFDGEGRNVQENAAFIAAANPAATLELIAKLEDAQGEIRALRATEAGLREMVKALEEGLKSCHGSLKFLGDASDGDVSPKAWRKSGAEASELQALNLLLQNRALLEKKE